MDKLKHGKVCSSHEVFTPKRIICRNPPSGLSPSIVTAYDIFWFSTKSKMKLTYGKHNNLGLRCLFTYNQLVYRNRSIYLFKSTPTQFPGGQKKKWWNLSFNLWYLPIEGLLHIASKKSQKVLVTAVFFYYCFFFSRGGRGGGRNGCKYGTGVRVSVSNPTPFIHVYLAFKKTDPFIYLIVRNVDQFLTNGCSIVSM